MPNCDEIKIYIKNPYFESDPENQPELIEYLVSFEITSFGSPPHMGSLSYPGDPGDPPEWEILSIQDSSGEEVPEFIHHFTWKLRNWIRNFRGQPPLKPFRNPVWGYIASIADTEIDNNYDFAAANFYGEE